MKFIILCAFFVAFASARWLPKDGEEDSVPSFGKDDSENEFVPTSYDELSEEDEPLIENEEVDQDDVPRRFKRQSGQFALDLASSHRNRNNKDRKVGSVSYLHFRFNRLI